MGRYKKFAGQIQACASAETLAKIDAIVKVTGIKRTEVVRKIMDSALPDIDPEHRFWDVCKNARIFDVKIPANTIIPMIAGFLGLDITGKDEINGKPIKLNATTGFVPLLWALNNVKELFYNDKMEQEDGKSLSDSANEHSE